MTRVTTVFLDANVLYGIRLRNIILFLALEDALVARWSDRVQDEWIENLLRNRTDLKESDVMRSRDRMNAAVPNGIVTGYDHLIDEVDLPDPNDRHVVAAAVAAKADVILTFNLADFPAAHLARHGLKAVHPDPFLAELFARIPKQCLAGLRLDFEHYIDPPLMFSAYVDSFRKIGMPTFAAHIETLAAAIKK